MVIVKVEKLCDFVSLCSIKMVIVSVIVIVNPLPPKGGLGWVVFPFAKIQRARPRRVNAPKFFQN